MLKFVGILFRVTFVVICMIYAFNLKKVTEKEAGVEFYYGWQDYVMIVSFILSPWIKWSNGLAAVVAMILAGIGIILMLKYLKVFTSTSAFAWSTLIMNAALAFAAVRCYDYVAWLAFVSAGAIVCICMYATIRMCKEKWGTARQECRNKMRETTFDKGDILSKIFGRINEIKNVFYWAVIVVSLLDALIIATAALHQMRWP